MPAAIDLSEQWQSADSLATDAERLLAAELDAHASDQVTVPTRLLERSAKLIRESRAAREQAVRAVRLIHETVDQARDSLRRSSESRSPPMGQCPGERTEKTLALPPPAEK